MRSIFLSLCLSYLFPLYSHQLIRRDFCHDPRHHQSFLVYCDDGYLRGYTFGIDDPICVRHDEFIPIKDIVEMVKPEPKKMVEQIFGLEYFDRYQYSENFFPEMEKTFECIENPLGLPTEP